MKIRRILHLCLLSLASLEGLSIIKHLVLNIWLPPESHLTFNIGHVRLWGRANSWPQELGQNPCPWKNCQKSLKSPVRQKLLTLEGSDIRTQTRGGN